MQWSQIRMTYPDQWLVIEALEAHTTPEQKRELDQVAVVETCKDGASAMQSYQKYHRQHPMRELYFVHTSREALDIRVRKSLRIRATNGLTAQG